MANSSYRIHPPAARFEARRVTCECPPWVESRHSRQWLRAVEQSEAQKQGLADATYAISVRQVCSHCYRCFHQRGRRHRTNRQNGRRLAIALSGQRKGKLVLALKAVHKATFVRRQWVASETGPPPILRRRNRNEALCGRRRTNELFSGNFDVEIQSSSFACSPDNPATYRLSATSQRHRRFCLRELFAPQQCAMTRHIQYADIRACT